MTDDTQTRLMAELQSRQERILRHLPPEHHAEYHAAVKHVVNGRYAMAMLARSLSPAQTRVVERLRRRGDGAVLSRTANRYAVTGTTAAAASTVRALVVRQVLRWTRQDDEEAASLAERGLTLVEYLNSCN